jgi:hypothetical protein
MPGLPLHPHVRILLSPPFHLLFIGLLSMISKRCNRTGLIELAESSKGERDVAWNLIVCSKRTDYHLLHLNCMLDRDPKREPTTRVHQGEQDVAWRETTRRPMTLPNTSLGNENARDRGSCKRNAWAAALTFVFFSAFD